MLDKELPRILLVLSLCLILGFARTLDAEGIVLPLPHDDQQIIIEQLGRGIVGDAVPRSLSEKDHRLS